MNRPTTETDVMVLNNQAGYPDLDDLRAHLDEDNLAACDGGGDVLSTLPNMAPRGPKPHRRVCRGLAYCDWCEAWAAGRFDGPPRHRAPKHAKPYHRGADLSAKWVRSPKHRADVAAESGAA